jgi:hypothetical protein
VNITLRLAFDEFTANELLNVMARHNARLLRKHPSLPLLYDSGTEYQREKSELWQDVAAMYQRGIEDCDALSAARAGELIARGWRALRPGEGGYELAQRLRPQSIRAEVLLVTKTAPGTPGAYHCITRYQVGQHWYRDDPSARLGMYDGRRKRGNYPYGNRTEAELRVAGVIPRSETPLRADGAALEDSMTDQASIAGEIFEEARMAGLLEFGAAFDEYIAGSLLDEDGDGEDDSEFGAMSGKERRERRRARRLRRRARRKRMRAKNKKDKAKDLMARANKNHKRKGRKGTNPPRHPTAPGAPPAPPQTDMLYEPSATDSSWFAPGQQAQRVAWQRFQQRNGGSATFQPSSFAPMTSSASSFQNLAPGMSEVDRAWLATPDVMEEVIDEEVISGIAFAGYEMGCVEAANQIAGQLKRASFAGAVDGGGEVEFGFIRKMIDRIKERRKERESLRDGRKQKRKLRRALRKAKRNARQHERTEKAVARVEEQNAALSTAFTQQTGLPAPVVPGAPGAPGAASTAMVPGAPGMPGMAPMNGLKPVGPGISMMTDGTTGAFAIPLGNGLTLVQQTAPGVVTPVNVNQFAAQARLSAGRLLAAG